MVIALKPLIPLLSNEGSVMSSFERPFVIDNSKKRVPIIAETNLLFIFRQAVNGRAIIVSISFMGHERSHIQLFRKRDESRNLFILDARVLESFQMEARHYGQLFHR